MNRKYNLKLDLQFRCNNSTMKFNQFDNNTSDFFMRITNGGNLVDIEKAIVVLAVIKPSGKISSQFVEVENGLVYADLKPSMKDEIGIYTAKAMLVLEDKRVVTDVISYEVEEDKIFSLLNDSAEASEEFTLLTDMLSRLSTIETNEEQRVINEAERILSEENRKTEEAERVEAELVRQHEEAGRTKYDAIRESNENIRKQNESTRLANETNRIDEEAKRVEEENKRKLAEEERKSNELNRKSQEDRRVSNEVERISNENTRKANEKARQNNETTRQNTFANKVNEVDKKIVELNTTKDNFVSNINTKVDTKISEIDNVKDNFVSSVNTKVDSKISELDSAKSDMTNTVANKVNEVETRFNALTSKQQQDAEVIDARDGETSLKARLDRDIEKAKQVYVNVEGSHISTDSSVGYAKDVEILGNTVQNSENLADIRSVGDTVEGQELYEIPVVSCGKNLFNGEHEYVTATHYWCKNFIKVNPNTTYIISATLENGTSRNVDRIEYYNEALEIIKYTEFGVCLINTTDDTKYIKFRYHVPNSIYVPCKVQLEEGTVATSYEPYQEDKLTILSPVQLEKVGAVADRLIEKDGVWGVEKNVETVVLNGSESWKHFSNSWGTLFDAYVLNDKIAGSTNLITDTIPVLQFSSDETSFCCMSSGNSPDRTRFFIKNPPNVQMGDVTGFKTWLSENNVLVKYPLNTPQFIPLPHDQQIKLRTFANKTNISFGCEIEGTIKAQVPKSLGATVNTHTEQIRSLNNELNRVKKLEESTVSTVTTESDFTTVEATSNGYFEDVKLEGKTLVNELGELGSSVVQNFPNNKSIVWDKNNIKLNTIYTLVVDCKTNSASADIKLSAYELSQLNNATFMPGSFEHDSVIFKVGKVGRYITKVGYTSLNLTKDSPRITLFNGESGTATYDIMLLEGDHTQNPPSYFEGLKSVGDTTDEIVVSSGINLFNKDTCKYNVGTNATNGVEFGSANYVTSDFIKVKGNTNYYVEGLPVVLAYDSNKNFIRYIKNDNVSDAFITDFNCAYVKIRNWDILSSIELQKEVVNSAYLIQGTTPKPYTPYQSDKKRLLYYNNETQMWEKPVLRQWDSIEKHADGKYYYHKRSEEVVLNGTNVLFNSTMNETSTGNKRVGIKNATILNSSNKANDICLVCDKLSVNTFSTRDKLGLYTICNGFQDQGAIWWTTNLFSSNTSSELLTEANQWLQANNVTVVYQLAQEKVYECTNIDLITYANETNYIVESGVLSPKTTLKVHNNISNVVSLLQKKVSLLESNVTSYMITQNRLMLASRYNADTVSFKVDVASFSDTFEYDNDLYELILNNILVGKDNYNREYIENLIIFYWMDFIISDEMYSTLFEIIEEQHNPKIEEETHLI